MLALWSVRLRRRTWMMALVGIREKETLLRCHCGSLPKSGRFLSGSFKWRIICGSCQVPILGLDQMFAVEEWNKWVSFTILCWCCGHAMRRYPTFFHCFECRHSAPAGSYSQKFSQRWVGQTVIPGTPS